MNKSGAVKRYLNFNEIPIGTLPGTWYILGRVNTTVNELRMCAKDAGLYYGDNKGTRSFDSAQWSAIKAWTKITKGKSLDNIGMFGGIPIFSWILCGFVTRNAKNKK